jgi:deoxyribodipyrimidine photolyase
VQFSGVPAKAWVWQKQTEPHRKLHVYGATRQGHLTAPDLVMKSAINILESLSWNQGMPFKSWSQETPSSRNKKGVFTVEELGAISDIKDWVSNCWPGVDTRVLPCQQTCGSGASARQRWKTFSTLGGLKNYAKKRNQTVSPHAVSRISCYLNLGILSIFDVVHDVWHFAEQKGWAVGCCKFLEEVVKWREIGYCYTFCHGGSHSALVQAIPRWAFDYFKKQQQNNKNDGYSYNQLEQASTRDEIWNSMQNYLIDTGELHNNARMSWGKTVLHWQASRVPLDQVFLQLCRLNDRFALDGLSPPSYAGILWCFGWGDKPNSSSNGNLCVSTKWASRYRTGPDGFARAKDSLYQESFGASHHQPTHKKRKRDEDSSISTIVETNNPESIRYFFSPVSSKIIG